MTPAQQTALDAFITQFLFPHEGVTWENDPNDDGNKGDGVTPGNVGTRFGVDAASHPGINIVDLTAAGALLIYEHEFNTSLASSLPWPLSPAFFDIHVNNGETRAIKILQGLLGVAQDGLVGPITMRMIGSINPTAIGVALPAARDNFYRNLALAVPKDRRYLGGWLARDADLIAWVKQHGTI